MTSFGDEGVASIIGLSRLAIHTTVRPGMLWYHMQRYSRLLLLELGGDKKPRAKSPPSEMSMSSRVSGFECVKWSSADLQDELKNRSVRKRM
jgi:hypothetical protein